MAAHRMSSPSVQKKECRDQALEKVVVFNDRAELKRRVLCELQPGFNEIHLENVTQNIIHDSVRVDGRGDGTIHDVQLTEKAAIHEDTDSPKVAEIRAKHENKLQEVNELKDRVSVVQKRVEVLDKLVEGAGNNVVCPPKDSREPFILNNETLESLTQFYSFYEERSTAVRAELRKAKKVLEKSERELEALEAELNRAESDHRVNQFSKLIVITLESEKGGSVQLELTYQVYGAHWSPSYDLRVDTSGKQSLKITYFGNISQSTGEDWSNASLVLSTAQPCLGGQIPELGVLEAVFYRPPPPPVAQPYMARTKMLRAAPMAAGSLFASAQNDMVLESTPMHAEAARVVEPAQHALSTEFIITKPAAIPSDGAEHKVTIGVVDVTPQMIHECVPCKNTSTFLTASAVNSSALPFLPGSAAVYLNNSFVAKTHMKNVSPGERFSCSLGVDTALRVEYKPVKKYHEQVGLISKSSSNVHEQVIVVKNSRAQPVLLTIKEQIPRSTDDKIKVRLIAPVVSQTDEGVNSGEGDLTTAAELPKEGCRLKGGILEWTIALQDGKTAELHVKWAVDHPKDEVVEFVERH
uniref:Protein F37C4.5 n=1 Tax=Haemonchus contortus TaxID=6289 RepID=A0A7I4YKZ4_HAECO